MLEMKIISLLLSFASICLTSSQAGEIWGGKWSNTYLLFIYIEQDAEGNLKSIYRHKEHTSGDLSDVQPATDATKEGETIKIGKKITLRLDKNQGVAYGNFPTPRDAYLVKLKETDISKVTENDIIEAGWVRDMMTAEEAKKYVFDKEGAIKLNETDSKPTDQADKK